jgi:hypothetical protein
MNNDQLISMRAATDKAENKINRMDVVVANAEFQLRFFTNEIILFKRANKDTTELEKERAAAVAQLDAANVEWNAALEEHEELWYAYMAALKAFQDAKAAQDAEDAAHAEYLAEHENDTCSFCGQMSHHCGEDHADEMREIYYRQNGYD